MVSYHTALAFDRSRPRVFQHIEFDQFERPQNPIEQAAQDKLIYVVFEDPLHTSLCRWG